MNTNANDMYDGVWQTANDVLCRTPDEYAYWIGRFRECGKPEQALILEVQQTLTDKEGES